jgi:hypothetical protein
VKENVSIQYTSTTLRSLSSDRILGLTRTQVLRSILKLFFKQYFIKKIKLNFLYL